MLHQVQAYLTGINLRLLYLVGIPALVAVVLGGGIQRSFRGRPAFYWIGFAAWALMAVPFSVYRGGSARLMFTYLRTDFLLLFVLAGLVVTWDDCRKTMCVIASAAVVNLLTGRIFAAEVGSGRSGLAFGSLNDPNDFACHLLLILPFLLWVFFDSKSLAVRIGVMLGISYGVFLMLRTGSRGALVGLAASLLFFVVKAPSRQKIAILLAGPIAALGLLAVMPEHLKQRLTSFNSGEDKVAVESMEARSYLLRQSIRYTLDRPIFGVGPGEFPEYEGVNNKVNGTEHGSWHQTHNTYTQVSSECGIPALLFYLAAIISTFRLISSVHREARRREDCRDIERAAFCIQLAMAGFCTAIGFLNFT